MAVPLNNITLTNRTKWRQHGITVLTDNYDYEDSMDVDDGDAIYLCRNKENRVEEWKNNFTDRRIVAGGNGNGPEANQLSTPRDVLVHKKNHSILICDRGNRRVVEWPLRHAIPTGDIILSHIDCAGLAIDDQDRLYVSDDEKHEVRRWNMKTHENALVAGGNGPGDDSTRLHRPKFLFVDKEYSVYVADHQNYRVVKWVKGAKQGILVAGGYGDGDRLVQLDCPRAIIVDHLGNVYVSDPGNHRIIRWNNGASQGTIVVGGKKYGNQTNQVNQPVDFVFDKHGNLYVLNTYNTNRLQKFYMASN